MPTPSRIAVLGAGLTGLAAARQLARAGHAVDVFERANEVGGLARGFNLGGDALECYYHHLFTHDTAFRALATELGLELEWLPSRMGTLRDGRLYPFGGALDLLRFTPLPLRERVRFGLGVLAARRHKDLAALEDRPALAWLEETFGREATRVVWQPLLEKKFGPHAGRVSAAWIWGKIALRGSSRDHGEKLGYLPGGFQRFHEALAADAAKHGARIHLGVEAKALTPGWQVDGYGPYGRVLVALPTRPLLGLAGPHLAADERAKLEQLAYRAAVVAVLALDRALTPYYWINVNDLDVPFGALIEHTNLVSPARYAGQHVVYLSRYLGPDEPFYGLSDEAVLAAFLPALRRFNPAFDPGWIRQQRVFRDAFTQPVVTPGYPRAMPPMKTSARGLYLANMAHIYPQDRGMNYAIALGQRAAAEMLS
jgi:protoporphyrinogen oxidase